MRYLDDVKDILSTVLNLGERTHALSEDTYLLGSLPELDSLAAVNLIAALEEHFGITLDDDEISATTFSTVGSLAAFVEQKFGK